MASDYKKIAEENQVRYGSDPEYRRFFYEQLYKEKTHFTYELIQNAVDSKSSQLELRLKENELFVWNDGDQFSEKDVRSICSLGSSSKDLTQIGTFGIGFKSVYNYTDYPEIYSGDEHFRIRDLTQPEGIDKMTPQIVEQVSQGRTVFRLPFKKDELSQDELSQEDIVLLKDQFCKLGERYVLLFLRDFQRDCKRHFKTIRWIDERDGQTGICSYIHHPHNKIQDASEVELTMSVNGENQLSEMFLVFHKVVQPPQCVIHALLKQAKHDEKRQKIQQSAKKQQPIEIAFKLQDGSITAMDDNCVLFAYLPTRKETHLKFLIQARYQTTSGRADIQDPSENPWNRWLVQETAKFLPEILEQLRASDLLEPAFFNVLPLREDDKVPLEFEPIVKALEDAMGEKPLVPTQDGGYAKAENVFYPESTPLRKLVKSSGMHSDSSLLHPYIRKDAKESERCFDVMAKAGVKEINASDLLRWLEKQSLDWFKERTDEWLRSLYVYFNRKWSESEWERIKKLPLVRLENEEHVCVSEQLVFFPPDTDEDLEDIKPFLNDLPILQSVLLEGEDHDDVKAFLGEENLGVEVLHPENLINKSICPLYNQPNKPSIMKNRRHVRYIFQSWQKTEESERSRLEKSISEVPILRVHKGTQQEISDFVVPCDAYLPQVYTGDNDLETYFSVSDGAPWFVDDKYLTKNSDRKAWLQFLKAIGAVDTPRVIKRSIPGDYKECSKRSIQRAYITRTGEETIEDHSLHGLSAVLNAINEHRNVKLSQVLWSLLVKALPLAEQERETFFKSNYKGTYYSKYRSNSYSESNHFDAVFYRDLKSVAWIPDKCGKLHSPNKCFRLTSENQEILGNIVPYVHSDFDMNTRPAQWLAKKLDVRLEADADNVLNYLQTLSQESQKEASIEKVESIYKFLESEDDADLERFEKEPLIFTPEPEPRWWRTDEVFWKGESRLVFGDDRGYLEAYYSEDLKSFFTTSLEVRKDADTLDYVRGIQDIITYKAQAGDKETRERVQKLYRCLWRSLQENRDSLEGGEWQEEWEQVREEACWLGRKGDEWEFFPPQELFWNDHPYLARIFEGKVAFWEFTDELLELAKDSGIEGCSQARVKFVPSGDQENDEIWSRKVQELPSCIHAFLKSSHLCARSVDEKSLEILSQLSVRRVEKLEVTYELNDTPPIIDLEARQCFLDKTNQGGTFWLALEAKEDEYAELIGDASQDYFGVKELRGFVEDLLTKDRCRVLTRWKRDGLRVDLCESTPEMDCKESEEIPSEFVDEEVPGETDNADDSGINESENETLAGNENSETGDEDNDSTGGESDTPPRRPRPDGGGARWRGGSGGGKPYRNRSTGYGGGGGGESEEHEDLKDYIADNPSELGNGLKLVKKEYTFKLGGRVDILLQDSSGNPVTVEVKPYYISPESNNEIWQAVRYKHVAAAEYGLQCDQVRSILVAPEIHDDVKAKCKQLGIEVFEKIQR